MHLCQDHQQHAEDPHAGALERTQRALNRSQPGAAPRCGTCGRTLESRKIHLCEPCATRDRLCQVCSTSTLPPVEQVKLELEEAYERVLDLATLAMKAYGISAMRELLKAHRDEIGAELVDRFFAFDGLKPMETMGFLDGRIKRPIWTKALGANVYRSRRCEDCGPVPRQPRALIAADRCGHLTPGLSAAWCPLCAADHAACEACGTSI